MKLIATTKTLFAIKSGGHSSNQGFPSTKGIQISMTRLNQVTLSSDKSQVTVGLGNVSARALEPQTRELVFELMLNLGLDYSILGIGWLRPRSQCWTCARTRHWRLQFRRRIFVDHQSVW